MITGRDAARLLGRPLRGASLPLEKPADWESCGPGDVVWLRDGDPVRLARIAAGRPSLVVCPEAAAEGLPVPHIVSERPRLDYIRILRAFFLPPARAAERHPTALVAEGARLGRNPDLGAHIRIGPEAVIGDDVRLDSGVVVEGRVVIGDRCAVKSNSVLGGQGFGFERDEDGTPIHFPHLGSIVLEDDVWIGACSTVELGTLGETRLEKGVKVDDLVQIGHNARVGAGTLIMANSVVCGGVVIGERCWIAPNSVIKEKVRIGAGAVIGLGSVVLRDVAAGLVVAGVPAKPIPGKAGPGGR